MIDQERINEYWKRTEQTLSTFEGLKRIGFFEAPASKGHRFTISEWRKDKDDAINDWTRFVARNPDFTYEARCVRREVGDIEVLGSVEESEAAK